MASKECAHITIRKAIRSGATEHRYQRTVQPQPRLGEDIRQFGRGKTIYDPWHYLGILEHKPGALRDGAPFKDWELPSSLQQVQRRLLARSSGDREFVAILCAARAHGLAVVERACRKALLDASVRGEVILSARHTDKLGFRRREPGLRLSMHH